MNRLSIVLLSLLSAFSFAGARVVDVQMLDFRFSPETVVVQTGDTVRWTNSGAFSHTTTSGLPDSAAGQLWDSPFLATGGIYLLPVTFTGGNIPYFCRIHSLSMRGRLTATAGVSEERRSPASRLRLQVRTLNPKSLVVELSEPADASVSLYDATGRLLVSYLALHSSPFTLPRLGPGIYIASVRAGNLTQTARFVVAR
jgi:plastocyanin